MDAPCFLFASGKCYKGANCNFLHRDNSPPPKATIEAETEMLTALQNYIESAPNSKICTVPTSDAWNLSAFYANSSVKKGTFKIKAFCTRHKDVLSWKTLEDGLNWICLSDGSNSNDDAKVGLNSYYLCLENVFSLLLYLLQDESQLKEELFGCAVCMDRFNELEGVFCANRHFICSDCFGEYAKSAGDPGAIGRTLSEQGDLRCCGCDDFYDLLDLAIKSPVAFRAVSSLRDRYLENRTREEVLESERQIAEKLKLMDEVDRISNDITAELCLKCPRCRSVFLDFSDCFALTCGNGACMAGFCAWCLADCGRDAHSHVLGCKAGNGSYSGTEEQFNAHHSARRDRVVRQRLSTLQPDQRIEVFNKVRIPLLNLGIRLQDLEAEAAQVALAEVRKAPPFPIKNTEDAGDEVNDSFFQNDDAVDWILFFRTYPDIEVRMLTFFTQDDNFDDRRMFFQEDGEAWQNLIDFLRRYGHWA